MNSYHNIPDEMKGYKQFLNWRYEQRGNDEKPAKGPYNPNTSIHASVTNPNDWVTFDEAVKYATGSFGYDGIGFVLTKDDPFCFIDLDDTEGNQANNDRQVKIYEQFDSYTERSPSGKGAHIIVKAKIIDGRRRNHVEIYDNKRYMTMTGDMVNAKPIEYRQELAHQLWTEMGGTPQNPNCYVNANEKYRDEEIFKKASEAENGSKFTTLYFRDCRHLYQSHSQADLALINIIAFYTQNRAQIKRIFRASVLGKRHKANRDDYLDRTITKAFDNVLPPIDFIELKQQVDAFIAQEQNKLPVVAQNPAGDVNNAPRPKGLLPAIAQFIYDSSPYVVWEIAWAGALGLMAGICGRAYNVQGSGLNLYILLLAPTGTGKESMKRGITKLLAHVTPAVPVAMEFMGPGHIASAPALLKYLADSPTTSVVSVLPEVGMFFKQIASERANSTQAELLRALLDLYHKSGGADMVNGMIYSDKAKNIAPIKAPAFTFIGESVPDSFYEAVDERMISSGLLPRFTIIEYNGLRPEPNDNHHTVKPSTELLDGLANLITYSLNLMKSVTHYGKQVEFQPYNVALTEEGETILKAFRAHADTEMRRTKADVVHHLWNRAHIKAMKYAALGAISENMYQPLITKDLANWATCAVNDEIRNLQQRFERGEIGKDDSEQKQLNHLQRAIREYFKNGVEYATKKYNVSAAMYDDHIITRKYLYQRISNLPAFKNDRQKTSGALDRCVDILISWGVLVRYPANELADKHGTSQQAYLLRDVSFIEEPEKG